MRGSGSLWGKWESCAHDDDMTDAYGTKTAGAKRVLLLIVVTRVGRGRHIAGRPLSPYHWRK